MAKPLRILMVEDSEDDTALLIREIRRAEYDPTFIRVETAEAMRAALDQAPWDLVISDHNMPQFNAQEALRLLKMRRIDIPFIIVSGVMGEEAAVAAMKAGAQDYIMKGRLSRLVPAIERELREAENRRAQSRAEDALLNERNLIHTVINSLPQAIYAKDLQRRFILSNQRNAQELGFPDAARLIGKTDDDIFPREQARRLAADEEELMSGRQAVLERIAQERDSQTGVLTRFLRITKLPLRDRENRIVGLVGINIDLTELKKTEDDLRQAKDEAETANQAKSQFVMQVSHELRTPLTSMKFELGNLIKGVVGPLPDAMRKYLDMMNADCTRLTRTVNDILDLNRVETRTLRLNRIRMPWARLVKRSAEVLRSQAEAKHLDLAIVCSGQPCFAECDPQKMERVIFNIVINAVNFTPPGGAIEVVAGADPGSGRVILEVTDTGVGIPPEYIDRVTEPYFMIGKHVSGTGLGLSIAKEIVGLHQGRLDIVSPPEGRKEGTRVRVELPLAEAPRIMVADDDAAVIRVIERQLGAYGYRVLPNGGGEAALRGVTETQPDMLILDLYMPGMSGNQVILRMKSEPALRGIPILVLTGGVPDRAKHEVLAGFGIQPLAKPWALDELLDNIEDALVGRQALVGERLKEVEGGGT